MNLALDLINYDQESNSLKVSFDLFQNRVKERKLLESIFEETGGKYIAMEKGQRDPEFA